MEAGALHEVARSSFVGTKENHVQEIALAINHGDDFEIGVLTKYATSYPCLLILVFHRDASTLAKGCRIPHL